MTKSRRRRGKGKSADRLARDPAESEAVEHVHISAPEAERLGLYPDWPTWPLGPNVAGDWEWLLQQVEAGILPDVPCRWSDHVSPGRSVIYWLNPLERTRHLVVGYGRLVLTSPMTGREIRNRMH